MSWLWILAVWTGLGLAWWLIALWLTAVTPARRPATAPPDPRRISIFKPAPAGLSDHDFARLLGCVESFVAELDADSELLIGCEADEPRWRTTVEQLRARYPQAEVRFVALKSPDRLPNRKVALMRALERCASGELWLWSDVDMYAPPGTLRSLREDFAATGGRLVTSPYVIGDVACNAQVLDTLFVDVEFLPGVILLGRLGLVRFGFGSCMLFEAKEFHRRVDWEFLGSCLADDFHLGRLLGPARLGSMRLSTLPDARDWSGALLHYLKWHKTILWCQPRPYALQLSVLPIVGWIAYVLVNPGQPLGWLGLATVVLLDVLAALAICRTLGCAVGWRRLPGVALWSLARGATWLACWLPWPVIWRGQKWWSPRKQLRSAAEVVGAGSSTGSLSE